MLCRSRQPSANLHGLPVHVHLAYQRRSFQVRQLQNIAIQGQRKPQKTSQLILRRIERDKNVL